MSIGAASAPRAFRGSGPFDSSGTGKRAWAWPSRARRGAKAAPKGAWAPIRMAWGQDGAEHRWGAYVIDGGVARFARSLERFKVQGQANSRWSRARRKALALMPLTRSWQRLDSEGM